VRGRTPGRIKLGAAGRRASLLDDLSKDPNVL